MFDELQRRLGYSFKRVSHLEMALTHPSYGREKHIEDNQRLEFLGDAVLELAVSRLLYSVYPEKAEGDLSRMRSVLVREETLSAVAAGYDLGKELRMALGEEKTGGRTKPSVLADAFEAVIAAIYLDGGTESAFDFVERSIDVRNCPKDATLTMDAKSHLQELLQKNGHKPVYEIISTEGPVHAPVFTAQVTIDGEIWGKGTGHTKRQAQQEAAACAIAELSRREGEQNCD